MPVVLEIDEGLELKIEVNSSEDADYRGRAEDLAQEVRKSFSDVLDTLEGLGKAVGTRLKTLEQAIAPQEVKLALGITIGAEGSVWLAKANAEAAITVEYTWKEQVK